MAQRRAGKKRPDCPDLSQTKGEPYAETGLGLGAYFQGVISVVFDAAADNRDFSMNP